jgi:hypothetical protein
LNANQVCEALGMEDAARDWHPKVRALYDLWRGLRPDGTLPGRRDFDPVVVPRLLPNIWLVDVQAQPMRFRYRLLGTAVVFAMGRDLRGSWFDDAHPEFAGSPFAEELVAVANERAPRHHRGPPFVRHIRDVAGLERIILPLAADGVTVDMLLCLTVFTDVHGHEIAPPRR